MLFVVSCNLHRQYSQQVVSGFAVTGEAATADGKVVYGSCRQWFDCGVNMNALQPCNIQHNNLKAFNNMRPILAW